jgi:hypothetical protein
MPIAGLARSCAAGSTPLSLGYSKTRASSATGLTRLDLELVLADQFDDLDAEFVLEISRARGEGGGE